MAFDALALPYRSVGVNITNGAETTIFTASAKGGAHVVSIRVAKQAGSTGTVTLKWTDSSASATYWIGEALAIAANTPLNVQFDPLALSQNDTIKATPNNSDDFDFIVTYVEYAGRSA